MKNPVDKGESFEVFFTNISKAFDCLDHELLNPKLNAYRFSLLALRLNQDYLSNRKQRTKIYDNYSFGQKYYLAFRKVQFLVHFFLIFSWWFSFLL